MDHFENLVATLLEADDYWVRRSFKVDLTKEEKRAVGKPSIPRPEIDLLALHFKRTEVLAIEAKSYLDSHGVKLADLTVEHDLPEGRYKLFTSERFRSVVLRRLLTQLVEAGMVPANASIRLGLAAGNVHSSSLQGLQSFMDAKGWWFWSPAEIKRRVVELTERGYENDPAIITAKILLR